MQTIYAYSYNPAIATGTNTTGTNWRMAYQQPIMLYKGTANTIRIVVFATNQRVVNLTNYDVQIQIVDRETEEHLVTRTATITAPTSGVASVTFTEADLRGLQNRFYHVIARLIDPDDGSSLSAGEILYLDDNYGAFTPVTVENAWNYQPTNISTTNGVQDISFTNIGETPDSFSGQANRYLRVNSAANAVEFASFGTFNSNIIPVSNITYNLGTSSNRWNTIHASFVDAGNIDIYSNVIETNNNELNIDVASQIFSITDNSTDPSHMQGDGGFIAFNDNTHVTDGPTIEVWYGNVSRPSDPAGQHSLDIHAAANSYVEFASYDLNSFIGIDSGGPFIQTDWNSPTTSEWRFGSNAVMYMPANSIVTSNDTNIQLYMPDTAIQFLFKQPNDTYLTHTFDVSGKSSFDGDVVPNANVTYSLGGLNERWNNLFMQGTIVADGITIGGEPYYAYLSLPDNANANVYTARLGNDNGNVSLSAMDQGGPAFEWIFDTNGDLTFPDGTTQSTAWSGGRVRSVPGSSIGVTGDLAGDIAFSGSYMYYCTANYNGSSNIWKRVAWSGDTW